MDNLIGKKFGRWTVLSYVEKRGHNRYWNCQCECGTVKEVNESNLKRGATTSCGCYRKEYLATERKTHGMVGTRIYNIYSSMKNRCNNPNEKSYPNYGGRGITICKEWNDNFHSFFDWAMANGYRDDLTIDRIDVNGNYEPSNCRWADINVQANNTRKNRFITFNGKTKTLQQWSIETGIPRTDISNRLSYGWSLDKALTMKPNSYRKNSKYITYNGETHNIKEWADILGMNVSTLSRRINISHWDIEKAFETPVETKFRKRG